MSDQDKEIEMVDKALDDLGEHFDSVMIFATARKADGSTTWVSKGSGCIFTRRGVVMEWMLQQDEMSRKNKALD